MSNKFVMVCKVCKFLSGPYNGVDTWFSCDCGERCFLSSKDIRSGKWRKFNRSTIPKTWLMNDQPLVVHVLEPHILRAIRLQDYEYSDNEEEDMDSVEDFDPERIADELEDEYDSDLGSDPSDSNDSMDISEQDEEEDESDYDHDEEEDDSDYDHDEEEDCIFDGRTPEEIDEEYEERYQRKRSQQ